jgi:hypothetical protein
VRVVRMVLNKVRASWFMRLPVNGRNLKPALVLAFRTA